MSLNNTSFMHNVLESRKQLAVYDSDTTVTFEQGKGHQTWYELVDYKQGYNKAKFEKSPLNSICERANDKVFKSHETHQLSPLNMCALKKIVV